MWICSDCFHRSKLHRYVWHRLAPGLLRVFHFSVIAFLWLYDSMRFWFIFVFPTWHTTLHVSLQSLEFNEHWAMSIEQCLFFKTFLTSTRQLNAKLKWPFVWSRNLRSFWYSCGCPTASYRFVNRFCYCFYSHRLMQTIEFEYFNRHVVRCSFHTWLMIRLDWCIYGILFCASCSMGASRQLDSQRLHFYR